VTDQPRIKPGDRLMVTTAFGAEVPAVADSHVEGTHDPVSGNRIHDFPVVWIRFDGTDGKRIPWPRESVRLVDEVSGDWA
jgi:hypothetical protein